MGQKGFTLTEVLISVVVLAIIAAAAVAQYTTAVSRSRFDTARQVLMQMYDAEWRYYDTVSGGTAFHLPTGATAPGTPCAAANAACAADWRDNLYMDNPNRLGGSTLYTIDTPAVSPPTFQVIATLRGTTLTQTITQDKVLCDPAVTDPNPCSWLRP